VRVTDGEPRTLPDGGDGRRSGYVSRVHLEVIAILLPIFVILVIVGWDTRPQSSGFAAVPTNVLVNVYTPNGSGGGSEVLHRTTDNGAVLDLSVGPPQPVGAWKVEIDDPDGARLCTPSELPDDSSPGLTLSGRPTALAPQRLTSLGTHDGVASYQIKSRGPLYVSLCWSSHGPVNLNGSYLSAQFPQVDVNSHSRFVAVPMTDVLYPQDGNTADFVLQSPATPATTSADSWKWSASTTSANALLRLSAVNTSASQHQEFEGFLSGLALGLAGGALIAILVELVGPISRARDARHRA
jgi:hypothetical protein